MKLLDILEILSLFQGIYSSAVYGVSGGGLSDIYI